MMHRNDDGSGGEKEQCLKEGMGGQMKNGNGVRRRPERHRHVPELGQGGIGYHPFYICLHQRNKRHQQRGQRTHYQDNRQGRCRQLKQRGHPGHQEDPRRDHGGRVDKRRNRSRPLHGIRQPNVQRDLGRLTHCTHEQ